jgi:hypothetical protein
MDNIGWHQAHHRPQHEIPDANLHYGRGHIHEEIGEQRCQSNWLKTTSGTPPAGSVDLFFPGPFSGGIRL